MAAAANAERLVRKETDRAERLLKEEDARRAEEEDARPSASQQSSAPSSSEEARRWSGPTGCASSRTGTRNRNRRSS